MKVGVLPLGACLVVDRISGWLIRAVGVGVSKPPVLPPLIALLSDGAGSSVVSGPSFLPGVTISS